MSIRGFGLVLALAIASISLGSNARADGWIYDANAGGYRYVRQFWAIDPYTGQQVLRSQTIAFRPGSPPAPYYGNSIQRRIAVNTARQISDRAGHYAFENRVDSIIARARGQSSSINDMWGLTWDAIRMEQENQANMYQMGAPLGWQPRPW